MPPLGLLPLLLPRVRLLPPLLRAPDPAAAQARASSSLPKICNLRVCPAHAAARHRYRSNLTPAAGLAPPPPQTPPPGPGRPSAASRGSRQEGAGAPGRACPSPGRPRARHCGARRLAGPRGLCGHAAPSPLLPSPCVTGLLCRTHEVRSGCGYAFGTGLPESPRTGAETSRGGAFPVYQGAPLGLREAPGGGGG